MPLIAVCYVKGAGGATTTGLGLSAVADAAMRPVLVECDPSGGDLMRRHSLAATPSLVDLAAAVRNAAVGDEVVDAVTQPVRLRDRTVAVVAAPGAAQIRVALGELARPDSPLLSTNRLVVADCGRWQPGSPVRPLLNAAQVVLVLARARPDEFSHVCEYLDDLVALGSGRLVTVLLRTGEYPAGEVAEVLADRLVRQFAAGPSVVQVAGPLPEDRQAAGVLCGDLVAGRRWRRLPLLTALRRLLVEVGLFLRPVSIPAAQTMWGRR